MNQIETAIGAGIVAVLIFDTLGSLASKYFGFSYAGLAPGSFMIYLLVGAAAGRAGALGSGPWAAAIVACVEATVGWAISWSIGPGRPPHEMRRTSRMLRIVATVTVTGALFGLMGAILSSIVVGRA